MKRLACIAVLFLMSLVLFGCNNIGEEYYEETPTAEQYVAPVTYSNLYSVLEYKDCEIFIKGVLEGPATEVSSQVLLEFDKDSFNYMYKEQSGLIPDYIDTVNEIVLDTKGLVVEIDVSYSYKITLPMRISDSFINFVKSDIDRNDQRKVFTFNSLEVSQLPLVIQIPLELTPISCEVVLAIKEDDGYSLTQEVVLEDANKIRSKYTLYYDLIAKSVINNDFYIAERESSVKVGLLPYLYMKANEGQEEETFQAQDEVIKRMMDTMDAQRMRTASLNLMKGGYGLRDIFLRDYIWGDSLPTSTTRGTLYKRNTPIEIDYYVYKEKEEFFEVSVYRNIIVGLYTNMEFEYKGIYSNMTLDDLYKLLFSDENGEVQVPVTARPKNKGPVLIEFSDGEDVGIISIGLKKEGKVEMVSSISIKYTDLWNTYWDNGDLSFEN